MSVQGCREGGRRNWESLMGRSLIHRRRPPQYPAQRWAGHGSSVTLLINTQRSNAFFGHFQCFTCYLFTYINAANECRCDYITVLVIYNYTIKSRISNLLGKETLDFLLIHKHLERLCLIHEYCIVSQLQKFQHFNSQQF